MLSETNGIGSKYQPGYGEFILLPKGCFSIELSYFYWVFYQGFCEQPGCFAALH